MNDDLALRLRDVATGRIAHEFMGICPDELEGWDSREAPGQCAACDVLREADAALTLKERR